MIKMNIVMVNKERTEESINRLEMTEKSMSIPVGTRSISSGVFTFPVGGQKQIAIIVADRAGNLRDLTNQRWTH
jgi:hypothetical protein